MTSYESSPPVAFRVPSELILRLDPTLIPPNWDAVALVTPNGDADVPSPVNVESWLTVGRPGCSPFRVPSDVTDKLDPTLIPPSKVVDAGTKVNGLSIFPFPVKELVWTIDKDPELFILGLAVSSFTLKLVDEVELDNTNVPTSVLASIKYVLPVFLTLKFPFISILLSKALTLNILTGRCTKF